MFLWRQASVLPAAEPELRWQYAIAALKEVDLGYAGRFAASHPVHAHLAALRPGDDLRLTQVEQKWVLLDAAGFAVGRMAAGFEPPLGLRSKRITVHAVLMRLRDGVDAQYQHLYQVDGWALVLPEFMFEP